VSALVVGRVTDKPDRSSVMLELRSAHSGGAIARFQEQGSGEDALTSVSEKLAPLVLQAAGWQPPVAAAPPALAAISGPDSGRQAEAKDDGGKFGLGRANKDQPIKIRADELEVIETDEGRRFVFSLNVVVTQAEVMLQADRLEAFYPGEASQPDRLEARGHVRVRKGDRRASCDVAVYQRETQMLFCTGRAEMLHGCDLVRGDEIDFDLESERVKVRGAPSVLLRPRNEDPVTGETRCTAGAPDPGASS
jgi:lipopolysaccharide export system protein LptA